MGGPRWVRSIAATPLLRIAAANSGLFQRKMIPSPRQLSSQGGGTVSSGTLLDEDRPGTVRPQVAGDALEDPPTRDARRLDQQCHVRETGPSEQLL